MKCIAAIKELTFDEIKSVWEKDLWENKKFPIKTHSSMTFDGGYDMSYYNNNAYFWGLIDKQNRIIGTESGHQCNNEYFRIRGLWIDPRFRGLGLSEMLFHAAESYAKKEKCSKIWSFPRNSALPIYQHFGYIVCSDAIDDAGEIHWYVAKNITC